jgi:hypothetical protein
MNYWQPAIVAFRLNYLPAYKAAAIYVPIRHSTIVENPLQIGQIMQNKANLSKSQMNISSYITSIYDNSDIWCVGKNKAKTKPI